MRVNAAGVPIDAESGEPLTPLEPNSRLLLRDDLHRMALRWVSRFPSAQRPQTIQLSSMP